MGFVLRTNLPDYRILRMSRVSKKESLRLKLTLLYNIILSMAQTTTTTTTYYPLQESGNTLAQGTFTWDEK